MKQKKKRLNPRIELKDTCPHCGNVIYTLIFKKAIATLRKGFKHGISKGDKIEIIMLNEAQYEQLLKREDLK